MNYDAKANDALQTSSNNAANMNVSRDWVLYFLGVALVNAILAVATALRDHTKNKR